MTEQQRVYFAKFIFTLSPILPDLEADVGAIEKSLRRNGEPAKIADIIATWVIYQLERHLYLHLDRGDERRRFDRLKQRIDERFYQNHIVARDLLLSQIRPLLTHRETIPYTDRLCRIRIRLPDLHLEFL